MQPETPSWDAVLNLATEWEEDAQRLGAWHRAGLLTVPDELRLADALVILSAGTTNTVDRLLDDPQPDPANVPTRVRVVASDACSDVYSCGHRQVSSELPVRFEIDAGPEEGTGMCAKCLVGGLLLRAVSLENAHILASALADAVRELGRAIDEGGAAADEWDLAARATQQAADHDDDEGDESGESEVD